MRRFPNIYLLEELTPEQVNSTQTEASPGKWCPARPLGYPSFWSRIKLAWGVFTGKYDAVKWPGNQ